ncbi:MAG: flavin reductase family protein [Candidatus Hadarchaeum sp.]|uniref:flavin reductase family protein n=1 Tax=Candidatus Hadarchaeum sp. TaxID=2883567 RepID=UPI003D14AA6B
MQVDLRDAYLLIAPRPIVLITTVDKQGRINAAPMSWVTPVESDPPTVAFSTSYESDTYHNICETEEFVINLVPEKIKKQMYLCSKNFPRGVNELEKAKLSWEPSLKVKPPRVVECPANLECKLDWKHEGPEYVVIGGRVVAANAQRDAFKDGRINVSFVRPLLHISDKNFAVAEREIGL